MSSIFGLICLAACVSLLVPALVIFFEVLFALPHERIEAALPLRRGAVAVLVPAHDEEAVIAATVSAILSQLQPQDRLLVVADNCTDGTAAIAERLGAEVSYRHNDVLRGKGYALDHGIRALEQSAFPPELLIVVDADCMLADGCIERLAKYCLETGHPVQAQYMMLANPARGPLAGLAAFAWRVKNYVRPLGLRRAGLPCLLQGSGMAFPWKIISKVDLANGNIVEDLKLTIDLALAGDFPLFCPDAVVLSHFPTSESATQSQRARWEHGYIATVFQHVPRLALESLRRKSFSLSAMLLDLTVPPLALLVLLILNAMWISVILFITTDNEVPLQLAALNIALVGFAVLLAWARYGTKIISSRQLLLVPAYILAKIPLYIRFFVSRQTSWVKTLRK